MKNLISKLKHSLTNNKTLVNTGLILIGANMFVNVCNLIYSIYLGRAFTPEDFGMISLFTSLSYLAQVIIGGFSRTITYQSAYLLGKYNTRITEYWKRMQIRAFFVCLITTTVWLLSVPVLAWMFHAESFLPFLLFTPVWAIGFLEATNNGYLTGTHRFELLAILIALEAVVKLVSAFVFVQIGMSEFVYVSAPLGLIAAFLLGYVMVFLNKPDKKVTVPKNSLLFSKRFFSVSVITWFSSIAFISLDVVLVKHFLPAVDAGNYALLSLVGKMVFFLGSLFSQFVSPLVSKREGAKTESTNIFYFLLSCISALSLLGFLVVGVFGHLSVPIIIGEKAKNILQYLPEFTLAMVFMNIANTFVSYHQPKKHYLFSYVGFFLALSQVVLISLFHDSIQTVTSVILGLSISYALTMVFLHYYYIQITQFFYDLYNFFKKEKPLRPAKANILIFNWRDIKHIWAGGAEVYVHELAKRWVKEGNNVTVFAGNDGRSTANQKIDGIKTYRRGGTYTVYIWAMLYYLIKFRGQYDIIVDCENGIPFFTPLYTRKPVLLLIHHIHQDVFRKYMRFPLSSLAAFLEGKLMPVVYRNKRIITISDSSVKEIQTLQITSPDKITIVHPGINNEQYQPRKKTSFPLISYVGRLKPYKNVTVAVMAFTKILPMFPSAKLSVVGMGESIFELQKLVKLHKLEQSVTFHGKVSEAEKSEILAKSWICVQPSMVEGWGITVIEANASGTPVIASNVHGLKDSIIDGQTGILVEPKDVNALASAMTTLLTHPRMLHTLSERAYVWAKKFSWESSAAQLYRVVQTEIIEKTKVTHIGQLPVVTESA